MGGAAAASACTLDQKMRLHFLFSHTSVLASSLLSLSPSLSSANHLKMKGKGSSSSSSSSSIYFLFSSSDLLSCVEDAWGSSGENCLKRKYWHNIKFDVCQFLGLYIVVSLRSICLRTIFQISFSQGAHRSSRQKLKLYTAKSTTDTNMNQKAVSSIPGSIKPQPLKKVSGKNSSNPIGNRRRSLKQC